VENIRALILRTLTGVRTNFAARTDAKSPGANGVSPKQRLKDCDGDNRGESVEKSSSFSGRARIF